MASTWWTYLDRTATIAVIALVPLFGWKALSSGSRSVGSPAVAAVPEAPIELSLSKLTGSPSAPFGLLVLSDFQCPYCRNLAMELLPEFQAKYVASGRILLSFGHLPLSNHQLAVQFATASECAAEQSKFWEMHDALFERPRLEIKDIEFASAAVGLSGAAFEACMSSEGAKQRVEADVALATTLGIRGTPTLILGTTVNLANGQLALQARSVIPGLPTKAGLSKLVDELIQRR